MKGYKCFKSDMTCRGYQYEVGKTYKHEGEIKLCYTGFHFCVNPSDVFNYYEFDSNNRVCEVEAIGKVKTGNDKSVTNEIKIVRELTWHEVLHLVNTGKGNTGYRNSGDSNCGHWNSGNWNSGYRNSGDRNCGHWNSGDRNCGDRNSGHWNSGYWNSGDRNSGHWNSGDRNSGHWNSGDRNSGHWNSGYWNSGDRNSGHWNSGHRNSGDWNSGDWNSTNRETGFFNSKQDKYVRVFNKKCKREDWEKARKPSFIYKLELTYMEEDNLKTRTYKEAWAVAWSNATEKDKTLLKQLPNFNAKVFEEITGINVNKKGDN